MKNLIIIGNGFDLAHNLKSDYNNFIDYIIDSAITDGSRFYKILSIGANIDSVNQFKNIVEKHGNDDLRLKKDGIQIINKFFFSLVIDATLNDWVDIESKYYQLLQGCNNSRLSYSVLQLNIYFSEIKNELENYLSIEENKFKKITSYEKLFNQLSSVNSLVLNFNYTNLVDQYILNKSLTQIQLHGRLNDKNNPIIFGYAANDIESRDLINTGNIEYSRYIKKQCYKRTTNEKKLRKYLESDDFNILIFGHSCRFSDKLILNQLFNHDNLNNIRLFFYENYEAYFNTQINIDRIMANEKSLNKLIEFGENQSSRMPQYNDSLEQNKYFEEFIIEIKKDMIDTRAEQNIFIG